MTTGSYKKTKWREGSVYAVPLSDGAFGLAQAITNYMPNVVYVALFSDFFSSLPTIPPELKKENVISLTATWKKDLNNGCWANIGIVPMIQTKEAFPNEEYAKNGYIGAKNYDAGLLADFLNAYHGKKPWNVMYKEDYWESLLVPGAEVPRTAVILSAEQRKIYRRNNENA